MNQRVEIALHFDEMAGAQLADGSLGHSGQPVMS